MFPQFTSTSMINNNNNNNNNYNNNNNIIIALPPLVSPRDDVWGPSAKIPHWWTHLCCDLSSAWNLCGGVTKCRQLYSVHSLPCEQGLHFRCVSWRAKSSLCRQPFKSVGFFPVLNRFRGLRKCCVSLAWPIRVVAIFLFPRNSRNLATDLTINFCLRIWWQNSRMYDRTLNSCRQRLPFARQLTKRKCSLCSQGIHSHEAT